MSRFNVMPRATTPENETTYIWIVSSGSGYYAESAWTTEEAAWQEAQRRGFAEDGRGRAVKRWKLNTPEQIWEELP